MVTGSRTVTAPKVLITSGGRSYPGCGTTGDGYAWAAAFGHTIVPTRPALVPLTVQPVWVAEDPIRSSRMDVDDELDAF